MSYPISFDSGCFNRMLYEIYYLRKPPAGRQGHCYGANFSSGHILTTAMSFYGSRLSRYSPTLDCLLGGPPYGLDESATNQKPLGPNVSQRHSRDTTSQRHYGNPRRRRRDGICLKGMARGTDARKSLGGLIAGGIQYVKKL